MNAIYSNRLYIFLFCVGFLITSCKKSDSDNIDKPGDNSSTSKDDDETPHPTGIFNYSDIKSHPRILFTKEDENALKSAILTNTDLATVHEYILTFCNTTLNTAPVVRVLEGKRLLNVSRTALKRIFYLSYAYRMTDDKRYLIRAEREINAVCEFTDWNPSHFLDVGEMATGVAIGYDWLFANLTEKTRGNVRKALKEKAFQPSYNISDAWFLSSGGNWNQVCNTGLVYAALATYEGNKKDAVEIIERAYESIKLPLEEYAPTGNYTEGYMYWGYGTTYQVMFLAGLESAFGTDKDLHKSKGFLETAEYMLYMSGPSGLCFNYSDSYNEEAPNPAMFWLAKKSNNPNLIFNERKLIENGGRYIKSFSEDRLLPLGLIFSVGHDLSHDASSPQEKMYVGYGQVPVAMIRTSWDSNDGVYVGIKGGAAEADHGHMDSGSFVFESDGVRWAIDLGYQSYITLESKGVDLWNMGQNSQRWDVLRINNKFHNTLTINGNKHRVNGKGEINEVYDTDAERGVKLNLTEVLENDISNAERKIILIDEDYLSITDNVKTNDKPAELRWSMVTEATPEIIDNSTIKLYQNNKIMYVKITSENPIQIKTWSTAPTTSYDAENPGTIIVGFESSLAENRDYSFNVKIGKSI